MGIRRLLVSEILLRRWRPVGLLDAVATAVEVYCQVVIRPNWPQRKSVGSGIHGAFARYILEPARNPRRLPGA
jgi:hypothetical protein